ncbi:MAG: hypothetical protein RIF41_06860 [Polyangiaceae bacterium]
MARGYRDELASLRARKEALETEVAELRERHEEISAKEQELVEAQELIAELTAKVDELEDERPGGPAERRRQEAAKARQRGVLIAMAGLMVLGVVAGAVFVRASAPPPEAVFTSQPPAERNGMPACTIQSAPSDVAVYGGFEAYVANGGDAEQAAIEERHLLGRTPVALVRLTGYEVELTKPGYRSVTLEIPPLDPENMEGSCTLRTTLAKSR